MALLERTAAPASVNQIAWDLPIAVDCDVVPITPAAVRTFCNISTGGRG